MFPNPQELFDQHNWAIIRVKANYVHPRPFSALVVFPPLEKNSCIIFLKNNIPCSQLDQVIPPKETHETQSYKRQSL